MMFVWIQSMGNMAAGSFCLYFFLFLLLGCSSDVTKSSQEGANNQKGMVKFSRWNEKA